MAYNDDQFFYAALWWATTLDGGEAYADDVFRAYGKKPIALTPYKRRNEAHDGQPVTHAQFLDYFRYLYKALRNAAIPAATLNSINGGTFVELSAHRDSGSVLVLRASEAAGIPVSAHSENSGISIHETGQVFVRIADRKFGTRTVELAYPGRPASEYKTVADYEPAVMDGAQAVTRETLYRLLPLQKGQKYTAVYTDSKGTRRVEQREARDNEILAVAAHEATVPLAELTEDEILNGSPRLRNNRADFDLRKPGDADEEKKIWLEATDDPRIVKHSHGPLKLKPVTEKTSFYSAWYFTLAKPGDALLLTENFARPYVIAKEKMESGEFRFVPYQQSAPAPAARPRIDHAL